MNKEQITYLVFGIVLITALAIDLGLLSKKAKAVSIQKALWQTIFWVSLALGFFVFLWLESGYLVSMGYLSAYLMEWSLSIDNIFVFILIFSFFGVKEKYSGRVLLIGILMAIMLRIVFIAVGIQLIEMFHWLLYVFGVIILYTGINMFMTKHEEEENLMESRVYKTLAKIFPITMDDVGGKFSVIKDGKRYFTNMFVVIIMLATTDIIFALDSIPAVFAISQRPLVIYTSNIFAVLGLRSLFFLLKSAVNRFNYLQHGIALVLMFIGLKMLVEIVDTRVPVYISLLVILTCILASILYSINRMKEVEEDEEDAKIKI